jgi:hypothetical protein
MAESTSGHSIEMSQATRGGFGLVSQIPGCLPTLNRVMVGTVGLARNERRQRAEHPRRQRPDDADTSGSATRTASPTQCNIGLMGLAVMQARRVCSPRTSRRARRVAVKRLADGSSSAVRFAIWTHTKAKLVMTADDDMAQ